ncbi:MAG TPA: SusD/RagB family nutrient-binding outer membrane lipoprotein [Bacteroidales bacterium]|nr:SusD/RagB family nutrient-binding outer membrane lipoprotein [Bacteroidales bacterium]
MKRIKNILKLSLVATVFVTSSCNGFLDVNENPNAVTDKNITPELLFPQTQTALANRQASRFVFLNNWMGYWSRSGTFIPEQEETTYKITSTFIETNWDNAYNILYDLNLVKTLSLAKGDKFLAGAATVLSVKLWQEVVDMYGDVPYSKAFSYEENPRPAYDAAADIYDDLLVQLDSAVLYLNTTPKSSFPNLDMIYCRANSDKIDDAVVFWNKFANTIRLRVLLRQSAVVTNATVTAEMAKIVSNGGLLAAGENVQVNPGYVNETDKQSPFYANFGQTPTGSAASTNNRANNYFLTTVLKGKTDPRTTRFFKAPVTGTDYGALNGNANGVAQLQGSDMGPGLAGSATQDAWILPAFEALFLKAEAIQRGWLTGDAQAVYESAITENFTWLGAADADIYLTSSQASWTDPANANKIKLISYQKYIALCGIDPLESYSDLRRIGGGLSLAVDGNTGFLSYNAVRAPHLPYIMPYPQSEYTANVANVPSKVDIFSEKLFWQP